MMPDGNLLICLLELLHILKISKNTPGFNEKGIRSKFKIYGIIGNISEINCKYTNKKICIFIFTFSLQPDNRRL